MNGFEMFHDIDNNELRRAVQNPDANQGYFLVNHDAGAHCRNQFVDLMARQNQVN